MLFRQNTPGNFTQIRQLGRRRALTLYRYQDKNPYYYGRLSELSGETLELIDDLPYKRGFRYYLPLPISEEQRSLTVVCAYKDRDQKAIYWVLDESCSLLKRGSTSLSSPPLYFHIGKEHLWLVTHKQIVCVGVEKMPRPRRFELETEPETEVFVDLPLCGQVHKQTPAHAVDGYVGLFSSLQEDGSTARLHWLKLDEPGTEFSVEWHDSPDALGQAAGDALYLFGPENGVWRLVPGEDPVEIWNSSSVSVLALDAEHIYIGTNHHKEHETPGVVKLSRSDHSEVAFIEIDHGVSAIYPLARGLVVCSSSQWSFLPADGTTTLTSRTSPAGAIGFAQLKDGTCAVNASRELLILPPKGEPLQLKLPAHGRILGATEAGFIFDPEIELALPADDPDRARDLRLRLAANYELLIIDAQGERRTPVGKYDGSGTARFKSPVRNIYNSGVPGDDGLILPDRVILTEKNEPTLWSWSS